MMCFLILALLAAAGADPLPGSRVARSAGCDSVYTEITPDHTMCLEDVGQESTLSNSDINDILERHNAYRNDVTPTGTNLFKLIWDEDIAKVALKWAKQCTIGHDSYVARRVPSLPGVHIGQNAAGGYSSVLEAIDGWHSEVDDFEYGVGNTSSRSVGHYTQVVGYRTIRVGCGQASCSKSRYPMYQVCNYASAQMAGDLQKPYKEGASCTECPAGKCEGNLCNCDGKICLNGGSLDYKTCTCHCRTTHTGITCQTESAPSNCPASDPRYCNTVKAAGFGCSDWMKTNCPIKCDDGCPPPTNCNKQCTNAGTLLGSCKCDCLPDFTGDTCETLACSSNPPSPMCSRYSEADCSKYMGLKEMCPVLCGLCP